MPKTMTMPWMMLLCLSLVGCGLKRRGANSVISSVEINQQSRDIATLERSDYQLGEIRSGEDVTRQVFVVALPFGSQISPQESAENAYYDAALGCDALLMPYVQTERRITSLIVVNVVKRTTRIRGRCVHILPDADN